MKKIFMFLALFFFIFQTGYSQSVADAQTHLYYQRYESAKNILQAVIAAPNPSPDAFYWLGEIYLKQKKTDSAYTVLKQGKDYASKKNISQKESPLIYIGWTHWLLDTGQTAEARQQMEEILTATKYKDATALWATARAHIDSKNGDPVWALDLLDKARKRDKKNPAIFVAMGDAYRNLIDGSNAIVSYDKALRLDPNYAEAMYKKGLIYKSQNNQEIYIDRFTRAYNMDTTYAPAIYHLYYHQFYRNGEKAREYLNAFMRHSDWNISHQYMLTDLLYITKKYNEAVKEARAILQSEKEKTQPRLYKLIAYSIAATGDSVAALENMKLYFEKQKASEYVGKDFLLMAQLQEKLNPDKTAAVEWYKKALAIEKDKEERLSYMKSLAELQQQAGNREREALWRERMYQAKERPTNLDIYKWGIALYAAENYHKADSVFALYAEKYPEQIFGYLWRARSCALIDTTMETGLAVPHYKKLIEVAEKDPKKNKTALLSAYGYLGAYEANITRDLPLSLEYFDKMLQLDPENNDAHRFSMILKQWMESGENEKSNPENQDAQPDSE